MISINFCLHFNRPFCFFFAVAIMEEPSSSPSKLNFWNEDGRCEHNDLDLWWIVECWKRLRGRIRSLKLLKCQNCGNFEGPQLTRMVLEIALHFVDWVFEIVQKFTEICLEIIEFWVMSLMPFLFSIDHDFVSLEKLDSFSFYSSETIEHYYHLFGAFQTKYTISKSKSMSRKIIIKFGVWQKSLSLSRCDV